MTREKRNQWFRRVAVALVVVPIVLFLALRERSAEPPRAQNAVPDVRSRPVVQVATVQPAPSVVTERYPGVIRSADEGPVAFTISGRIETIPVSVGSTVARGDVVARQDQSGPRNAVQEAEAAVASAEEQLEQAERERDRVNRLGDAATESERDQRESAVETARAQLSRARAGLDEARRRLRETTLRAPYRATVTALPVYAGQVVSAGTPVAFLSGDELQYEVELLVPTATAMAVQPGDAVRIVGTLMNASGGNRSWEGLITSVSRHATSPSQLFPLVVSVSADAGSLPPGSAVRVELSVPQPGGTLVAPSSAVVGGVNLRPQLYTLENGVIRVVELDWVRSAADGLLVPAVVPAGTEVVSSGHVNLHDGLEVEVAR